MPVMQAALEQVGLRWQLLAAMPAAGAKRARRGLVIRTTCTPVSMGHRAIC